jgi:hypothetical protein
MAIERIAVQVPVHPWYRDHCFDQRVIFPAVEAMQLLAVTAQEACPALDVREMRQGRFLKFLEIPPESVRLEVVVELEGEGDDRLCARLLSKQQLKTMARMTTHCELSFAARASSTVPEAVKPGIACCSEPFLEVSAERVYGELVPFGPAYRTLQGQLFLSPETARGTLLAPALPPSSPDPIGSPFPLDGAMHAACVHGQQLVDFVPFPVGFATRTIHVPTQAGGHYGTQVHLQSRTAEELVYDLVIFDQDQQVRESATGLRMRDVSGGRIKPPAWIRSAPGKAC